MPVLFAETFASCFTATKAAACQTLGRDGLSYWRIKNKAQNLGKTIPPCISDRSLAPKCRACNLEEIGSESSIYWPPQVVSSSSSLKVVIRVQSQVQYCQNITLTFHFPSSPALRIIDQWWWSATCKSGCSVVQSILGSRNKMMEKYSCRSRNCKSVKVNVLLLLNASRILVTS